MTGRARHFLFLQGPHGPFFARLARQLVARGAQVRRVVFNAGDQAEWPDGLPAEPFRGPLELYRSWLSHLIDEHGITDLVLYGDTRALHRIAIELGEAQGLTLHTFEEGYLRPRFVTYERGGVNGASQLVDVSLAQMSGLIGQANPPGRGKTQDSWGDSRQHRWLSLRYHLRLLSDPAGARLHAESRGLDVRREARAYAFRALLSPAIRLGRAARQAWVLRSGRVFHLVLLQLASDPSLKVHSDYESPNAFLTDVMDGFAAGAAADDLLVFKAHPFESGRAKLGRQIRRMAKVRGISDRVVFLDGGQRLARLMDQARSVVTVNSTGAHQALWRGLPVAVRGRAVFAKPGIVSTQDLTAFFRAPEAPDLGLYWIFRRFLVTTSQFSGSFYAPAGIRRLLARLPEAMMAADDPYTACFRRAEARSAAAPTLAPPGETRVRTGRERLH